MTVLRVLWSITWGSWLTALAIVLIRALLRKVLSPKAKYYLWLLLALRLMLPVLPQSSLSVQNVLPQQMPTAVSTLPADIPVAPAAEPMPIVEAPTEVADIPTVSATPAPAPAEKSPSLPAVLLWIYALGVGISALVYLILYLRTARMLSKLPDCTDSETLAVWQSLRPGLSLPASIRLKRGGQGMSGGLIHPTIVLPLEITGSDAAPILIHEAQHIFSHDLWIMSLYRLLRCIYWFNPVVWLCFRQAFFDSEGACDQRVLESGLVSGKDYAQALYRESLLTARDGLYIRTAFGGKHTIRRRIAQIARFHGKRRWMLPLALVLVLTISACTLTARQSENSGASDTSDFPSVSDSVSSESSMALPADALDAASVSAPIFFTDGSLTFLNLPWGSTPEYVMDYMTYTDEDFTLTSRGRNFEADVPKSPPDYPEISKIQYEFHFVGLDLTKGLDGIELFYDDSQVTYDDLLADCTGFLGAPEQQDDKSANWTTDSAYVTLSNLNNLKLTLSSALRETDFETALSTPEDVAAYMDSLMPPNGHYGWTYQQHVDAGLLNPDDGVFTHEDENCDSFVTTINLGGEDVEARYYFVRNLPLMETDTRILTEVHVVPPEDVPFREWFAKFSDQYTNKLYQSQVNNYRTPITVGNLLTQEQKDEVENLALQYTGQYASTEAWSLSLIWRDGDLLKFNGTGYALYFALNGLVTN